jgi:hypothetical protein
VGGFGGVHGLFWWTDGRGGGCVVGLCVGVVEGIWVIGGCKGGHFV